VFKIAKLYHYTTLANLRDILESGGNFYWVDGFFNKGDAGAYYFTDLPPETSNSDIKRAIYGANPTRTDPKIHLQAYIYVEVDGRQVQKDRDNVFHVLKSSPNLEFIILEFGQRRGWQVYQRAERIPWDRSDYSSEFRSKGHVHRSGRLILKGMQRNV